MLVIEIICAILVELARAAANQFQRARNYYTRRIRIQKNQSLTLARTHTHTHAFAHFVRAILIGKVVVVVVVV